MTSTQVRAGTELGYRPELDGLRAVAAVMVVIHHWLWWGPGRHGVEVFFVLSGFLITTILLEDVAATGRVRLARFYERRARRLLPCLIAVVLVCVALLPVLQPGTKAGLLPALLYYSNWQRSAGVELGSLGHAWSLAVEEQFYLLWPLVVLATRRLSVRSMAVLCGVAAVVLLPHPGFAYLFIGASVAYGRQAGWRVNVNLRALSFAPLIWLGKRTYGLYLWHFPIGHMIGTTTTHGRLLAAVVTLVVVECSYRWIEGPFRSRVGDDPLKNELVVVGPGEREGGVEAACGGATKDSVDLACHGRVDLA